MCLLSPVACLFSRARSHLSHESLWRGPGHHRKLRSQVSYSGSSMYVVTLIQRLRQDFAKKRCVCYLRRNYYYWTLRGVHNS